MITNQQELNRVVSPMIETMVEDASAKLDKIVRAVGGVQRAARLLGTNETTINSIMHGNIANLTAQLLVSILAANGEALALVPMGGFPRSGGMPPMPFGREMGRPDSRIADIHGGRDIPQPPVDLDIEDDDIDTKDWDAMTRSELLDELAENGIDIPQDRLLRMTRGEMIEALERNASGVDGEDDETSDNLYKNDILDMMAEALDKNPELTQCFAEMMKRTRR